MEVAKNQPQYYCKYCDYYTYRKNNFTKHTLTSRHSACYVATTTETTETVGAGSTKQSPQVTDIVTTGDTHYYMCEICNKLYKNRSGLWKHKNKGCTIYEATKVEIPQKSTDSKDVFLSDLLRQNNEVMKHNRELTDLVMDIIRQNKGQFMPCFGGDSTQFNQNGENPTQFMPTSETGNQYVSNHITNTNNNTNMNNNKVFNQNNQFNLSIFLKDKCKNAMDMSDFVNSVVVDIDDLEETGRLGFAQGVGKILVKHLNQLEEHKRPLHCTDLKREIFYVKEDGKWEKDTDKTHLTKAIKVIANKNIQQIYEWQRMHPNFNNPESQHNDHYMKLVYESMSGDTEEECKSNYNRIISTVAKEVTINKNM